MEDIERLMMNETEHYETTYFDGIEVGRSEGFSLGKSKGKNDRNIEIAKNMLDDNVDISLISKYTKLSKKEINALK